MAVSMKFEALKTSFKRYLIKNAKDNEERKEIKNSDKSIFLYSEEFKTYLEEELNMDLEDLTKSMKDFSKLEYTDGQLTYSDLEDDEQIEDFNNVSLNDQF